jgi:hypothetical protein
MVAADMIPLIAFFAEKPEPAHAGCCENFKVSLFLS